MIRPYRETDADSVVQLSLRAWEPVFASIRQAMDAGVFQAFYPNGWRESQRYAVSAALAEQNVWVAEQDDVVAGFVSVVLHHADNLGEIYMIAVDPEQQGKGIGMALTEHAVAWMQGAGMGVAMVETGGDPGHSPARHTYERAGFRPFPVVRYFKKL